MTPEERELEEASRRARRQRHRDIQEAAREEALAESRRRVEAELAALANIGRRGRNFVNSLGNNDNVTPTTATPANRGRRGRNLANRPLSNNNNN
jgi:hypothetical protein